MTDVPSQLQRELKQTRPFLSPAQEAAVSILRTSDMLRRRIAAVIEPEGITMQQYNVLRILRGSYPKPLATLEIAERLIEQTPGITRLLDRLEEKGLVSRQRSAEDRRLVHCWVTPEGLALLERLQLAVDEADEVSMRKLDRVEVEALIDMLARIRAS